MQDDTTKEAPASVPPIHSGPVPTDPTAPASPQSTGSATPESSTAPGFRPGGPPPILMTAQGWMADVRAKLGAAADSKDGQQVLDQLIGLIEAFLFNQPKGKANFNADPALKFSATNPVFNTPYDWEIDGSATISCKQANL